MKKMKSCVHFLIMLSSVISSWAYGVNELERNLEKLHIRLENLRRQLKPASASLLTQEDIEPFIDVVIAKILNYLSPDAALYKALAYLGEKSLQAPSYETNLPQEKREFNELNILLKSITSIVNSMPREDQAQIKKRLVQRLKEEREKLSMQEPPPLPIREDVALARLEESASPLPKRVSAKKKPGSVSIPVRRRPLLNLESGEPSEVPLTEEEPKILPGVPLAPPPPPKGFVASPTSHEALEGQEQSVEGKKAIVQRIISNYSSAAQEQLQEKLKRLTEMKRPLTSRRASLEKEQKQEGEGESDDEEEEKERVREMIEHIQQEAQERREREELEARLRPQFTPEELTRQEKERMRAEARANFIQEQRERDEQEERRLQGLGAQDWED